MYFKTRLKVITMGMGSLVPIMTPVDRIAFPLQEKPTAVAKLLMQGSGLGLNAAAPVWFPYPGL